MKLPTLSGCIALGLMFTSSVHALSLPNEVNCLLDGEVYAMSAWHPGAGSLVEFTQGPGRIDLTSQDGTFTQWAYGDFNGMTVRLCANELDLTLNDEKCLKITASPRQYEQGIAVGGWVGELWRGEMRCELPLQGFR